MPECPNIVAVCVSPGGVERDRRGVHVLRSRTEVYTDRMLLAQLIRMRVNYNQNIADCGAQFFSAIASFAVLPLSQVLDIVFPLLRHH